VKRPAGCGRGGAPGLNLRRAGGVAPYILNSMFIFSRRFFYMRLLFKKRYYNVNACFWTAVEYRLSYCASIFDITGGDIDTYVKNLINLLYVAIDGDKPDYSGLLEEARNPDGHLISFCNLLYKNIMKKDMLLDEYIKKYNKAEREPENIDKTDKKADELDILEAFKLTGYPERLLYIASVPQVIGLILKFADKRRREEGTEYREMSAGEIKNFYGVK